MRGKLMGGRNLEQEKEFPCYRQNLLYFAAAEDHEHVPERFMA